MRVNTYKHKFGFHSTNGLRCVYDSSGGINFHEPAPENESMSVEYEDSRIEFGPKFAITIHGNVKEVAFGFALLLADNLDVPHFGNHLITKLFEFDKENNITKSLLETNEDINAFIEAFNKVWPSVLLLG